MCCRFRHSEVAGDTWESCWGLITDTYIAEVVHPIEDVDIIGHDWVVPDMSGWGGGRHRLALTWKSCRKQQYRERPLRVRLDLPEVSSTLIVRLLSHEPISPLSAKRGFWNTEDISCSLTHKYFSNDLQLVTFGNIQLNFSFFDKMMLVLILERN